MGVLTDYFAAPSDEDAAAVIDLTGGPGDASTASETVALKGIDPLVKLGKLEELLTGVSYDQISLNPRWGATVAERDDGERLVLTITNELQAALAGAEPGRLSDAAVLWSQTDECRMDGFTSDDLAQVLDRLAALARGATQSGASMYCWMCV